MRPLGGAADDSKPRGAESRLRIDPTFAPLKGNPRFERLVAGK
jgi:hypothetical protein